MKQFTCKACGCHRIEEIMDGVTLSSTIDDVELLDDGSLVMEYGKTSTEDGDTDTIRYQCLECGKNVTIDELKELAKKEQI